MKTKYDGHDRQKKKKRKKKLKNDSECIGTWCRKEKKRRKK